MQDSCESQLQGSGRDVTVRQGYYLLVCLRASSFIRAFPVVERRLKVYRELTPPGRGRLESRVGHGVTENPGTAGCGPNCILPRVGPVCCNRCVLWNHQGWEARP